MSAGGGRMTNKFSMICRECGAEAKIVEDNLHSQFVVVVSCTACPQWEEVATYEKPRGS